MVEITVDEPFPIFKIADKFLLFDINTITYARRVHHILGVLTGNIPQASQQNIFSGIPLELLPEETRLLVVKGHAFIVDDVAAHAGNLGDLSAEAREEFLTSINETGMAAAQAVREASLQRKAIWMAKNKGKKEKKGKGRDKQNGRDEKDETGDLLFGDDAKPKTPDVQERPLPPILPNHVTPTTSYPPLKALDYKFDEAVPKGTDLYHVFAHLHSRGYYMSPGLRFGCHLMAYPGDPLRYHSHFLVVGKGWNEPIDLLDVVGGGRLGTGVKKGYLLGGVEQDVEKESFDEDSNVRTFSFEWAAM